MARSNKIRIWYWKANSLSSAMVASLLKTSFAAVHGRE
jgi:hypothetical protein